MSQLDLFSLGAPEPKAPTAPKPKRAPDLGPKQGLAPSSPSLLESHDWSTYQRAIFDAVTAGSGHLAIVARAGASKTTVLTEITRRLPSGASCLVLAFNKAIAAELKDRVRQGCDVMTTHGLGLRAINAALGRKKPESDKGLRAILRRPRFFPDRLQGPQRTAVGALVSRAKNTLASSPRDLMGLVDRLKIPPRLLLSDDDMRDFGDEAEAEGYRRLVLATRAVLDLCQREAPLGPAVDFDDLLWLPHVLNLPVGQWDFVLVDEAQDLNRAQIELVSRAVAPSGRVVVVGDPKQAIYAFRGAETRAFDMLTERFGGHRLSLPVTYRCGRRIVDEARRLVPDFEAGPNNPEGEVRTVPSLDVRQLVPGDFILSRTNAPLVQLCFRAIAAGVPAKMAGRDLGRDLARQVRDAEEAAGPGARPAEVLRRVLADLDASIDLAQARDDDFTDIEDRKACIVALFDAKRTPARVIEALGLLFTDGDDAGGAVLLSTAHRAKGLEAKRVWMLRSTFCPERSPEEASLAYVAITRAQRELIYVEKEA